MENYDIAVIGAGAAGMFCAGIAGQRGARVVLIDHAERLAEKIRISGGGRCNFTNLQAQSPAQFLSADPRFARDILRAYPPRRFTDLLRRHGVGFHEKHRGQLFCDDSSESIISLLRAECEAGRVEFRHPVSLDRIGHRAADGRYLLDTSGGSLTAASVVVATGGLSIPKIGATDLGYRIARQFGLDIVETRPALVPLTFDPPGWQPFAQMSGLSLEVDIRIAEDPRRIDFREDLLFTHRGLSGPAVLQISSYWRPGESLTINLAAGHDLQAALRDARNDPRKRVEHLLLDCLPKRLAFGWLAQSAHADLLGRKVVETSNKRLEQLSADLRGWPVKPMGSEGYRKAEVTAGGVATHELDSKTLQARRQPGLYFIGEVVDVTGWLGGYNFQWAWASAFSAANAITADASR